MFTINGNTFDTFQEVVNYAWNTHKIEFLPDHDLTPAEGQEACRQLEVLINS